MSPMTSSPETIAETMHCRRHRAVATTMRCDRCYQPFCRDCLVSRFITSRSSIWLCPSCARSGSAPGSLYRGVGRPWSGGGVIRHPGSASGRGTSYWLAAAGLGALLLVGAYLQGLLPF